MATPAPVIAEQAVRFSVPDAGSIRDARASWTTPGGIPIRFRVEPLDDGATLPADIDSLKLHLEHARLGLLRGFDQLLCLDGLRGVEQLPHQIETVRKVLRRFRGRVLLADEVGLGKTIEACLLLREYLLRGLVRRVLILVPKPLVSQWRDELSGKFGLDFSVPPSTPTANKQQYWERTERVLASLPFAKSKKRSHLLSAVPWDLVIVDEAHHCKNRKTRNWQLVNSLKRRHLFLLTATPVQNNLVELYNLLTLLEPGHLKTEADFKRRYVRRGNPRDPVNRERLRSLLGEVMVRNTRSLVQMDLPPRYAQTVLAEPGEEEQRLQQLLSGFLRVRRPQRQAVGSVGEEPAQTLTRMQTSALLSALGSHPAALARSLQRAAAADGEAGEIIRLAASIRRSAKDEKLLELLRQSRSHKVLVFVGALRTLHHLQELLGEAGIAHSTFSGEQSDRQKDEAVEALKNSVPVMLCTDSGGEGRNLQFADTLINYDLPWNPMRIEQRVGRVHRIGQTQEVFVFNICSKGSLEERILRLLDEKIRMFELVVGEVGSILGNLDEGDQFESLVLDMWINAGDEAELDQSFESLGEALIDAQEKYVSARELDEALFGDDYE